jgi:hypothetical protein
MFPCLALLPDVPRLCGLAGACMEQLPLTGCLGKASLERAVHSALFAACPLLCDGSSERPSRPAWAVCCLPLQWLPQVPPSTSSPHRIHLPLLPTRGQVGEGSLSFLVCPSAVGGKGQLRGLCMTKHSLFKTCFP